MCDGHRRNGSLLIAATLMNSPGHGELALSCSLLIDEFDSAHNFSATVHCPCLLGRSNGYAVVRFLVRSTDTQRQTLPRCPLFSRSRLQLIGEAHLSSSIRVPYEYALCMHEKVPADVRRTRGQELQWWQTMDTCRRTTASLLRCWSEQWAQRHNSSSSVSVCSAPWTCSSVQNMSYVHANNTSKLPTW